MYIYKVQTSPLAMIAGQHLVSQATPNQLQPTPARITFSIMHGKEGSGDAQ